MGRRLGQHFLKAPWAARALAHAAGINQGDTVLEIGPGKGALTRTLLEFSGRVVAIEKDRALAREIEKKFRSEIASGRLRITEGDIRDLSPKELGRMRPYVVAANIPYYITGDIIRFFLSAEFQPRSMSLLVQKEVANRIVSKKASVLSLSVQAYGTPRIIKKVPRGNFTPAPSVDSAIIAIENITRDLFRDMREKDFFDVVHAGFSSKRKYLSNNLGSIFRKKEAAAALDACGIPQKARAEDVALGKWKCLAKQLVACRR